MSDHDLGDGNEFDEIITEFVTESREQLADIEGDFLRIEDAGADVDPDTINNVFRVVHSIKGAAGFLKLDTIAGLAHQLENVLNMVREGELVVTSEAADVMLRSADELRRLLEDVHASNDADVSPLVDALAAVARGTALEVAAVVSDGDAPEPSTGMIPPRASAAAPLACDQAELLRLVEQGSSVFEISVDISGGSRREDGLMALIADLMGLGEILASDSDFDYPRADFQEMPAINALRVLLATRVGVDELTQRLAVDRAHVKQLTPDRPTSSALPPTPSASLAKREHEPAPLPAPKEKPVAPPIVASPSVAADTHEPERDAGKADGKHSRRDASRGDASIRVNVTTLDRLMNLAGELVLGRNQLLRGISTWDRRSVESVSARIDQVTSELQEAIMQTRMQPIGNVFSKFPRVVRDLGRQLGKRAQLVVEGNEVELDRTIIEAINDPLTHLIRNSLDHGIETPEDRVRKGKPEEGTVMLRAFHQSGKVNIEICDDGRGIDGERLRAKAVEKGLLSREEAANMNQREALRLIFLPGMSTAEKVSSVSGRGVGMDVVMTNLDALGGTIEVDTEMDRGTTIRIKLPLTLAILTALLVQTGSQRYAIPQVNISELVRIRKDELAQRMDTIEGQRILRIRGEMLPLLVLREVLDIDHGPEAPDGEELRAVHVIIVEAGHLRYGLLVDSLVDAEEIVVKPLGSLIRNSQGLAGATILGDGRVALILDVAGLASLQNLQNVDRQDPIGEDEDDVDQSAESLAFVLFRGASDEMFAMPMTQVSRIERANAEQFQVLGDKELFHQGDTAIPVLRLERLTSAKPPEESERCYLLVFRAHDQEFGLVAPIVVDMRDMRVRVSSMVADSPGFAGSFLHEGRAIRIVDVSALARLGFPHLLERAPAPAAVQVDRKVRILLAEDSSFFRKHVSAYLRNLDYEVVECEDGQIAWQRMQSEGDSFDLLVTDIEMPNMTGLELVRAIRGVAKFSAFPIIAMTSLASSSDVQAGLDAGVNDYQVKFDKDALSNSISNHLAAGVGV